MFGWILRKIRSVYHYFAYSRPAKCSVEEMYDQHSDMHDAFLCKKRPDMTEIKWTPLEEHQNNEYSGEQRMDYFGKAIELTVGDKMNYDAYGDNKPKPKAKKKTTKKSKKKGKK
jgi:hypothetical protein